jgi:hypothetical protein
MTLFFSSFRQYKNWAEHHMVALKGRNVTTEGKTMFPKQERSGQGSYNPGRFVIQEQDVVSSFSTLPDFFSMPQ